MNTNTENWWVSIDAKKREELAATKDKFPESLSKEDIEIIFLEYQSKAVNNYDALLSENKSLKVDYEFADEMKKEAHKHIQKLDAVNDALLSALKEIAKVDKTGVNKYDARGFISIAMAAIKKAEQ